MSLLHNFIADMPGPNFLFFYAAVIVVTLIVCGILRRMGDTTASLPAPLIPTQPDPYEIAYLRGGEKEVAQVAVFNLIQRNFLQIVKTGFKRRIQQVMPLPNSNLLYPMEHTVFDWFSTPRTASQTFSSTLSNLLTTFCTPYQRRLEEEQFLSSSQMKVAAGRTWLLGALIIVGLGGYKLYVASVKGYSNVGFLIFMGIFAFIILTSVCTVPRLSTRGKEYLRQLQRAFEPLKAKIAEGTVAAHDTAYMLTVGLFGVSVLARTPYSEYQKMYRTVSSSSSNGGSCGGGSCGGGGGGCGGCGSGGH